MQIRSQYQFNEKACQIDFTEEHLPNRLYGIGQSSKNRYGTRVLESASLNDPICPAVRIYQDGEVIVDTYLTNNPTMRRNMMELFDHSILVARKAEVSFADVVTPEGKKVVKTHLRAGFQQDKSVTHRPYVFEVQGDHYQCDDTPLVWEDLDHNMLVPYNCHWRAQGVQYRTLDGPPVKNGGVVWITGQHNRQRKLEDLAWIEPILEFGRVSEELGIKAHPEMSRLSNWGKLTIDMTPANFIGMCHESGMKDGRVAVAMVQLWRSLYDWVAHNRWIEWEVHDYLRRQ